MNNPRKPLKEWFGYNRRERRATLFLMVIGLFLFSFRFIITEPDEVPSLTFINAEADKSPTDSFLKPVVHKTTVKVPVQQKKLSIELNSCDSTELVKLPGIGPVLSGRIIKFRKLLGGFADKNQLLEVYGLPEETYTIISSMVTVDTSMLKKIKLNSCEYRELIRHPYLSPEEVKSLLNYREKMGRIEDWNAILKNNLLTGEKAHLVRYYVSFD